MFASVCRAGRLQAQHWHSAVQTEWNAINSSWLTACWASAMTCSAFSCSKWRRGDTDGIHLILSMLECFKQSLPLSGIIPDKRQWHMTANNLQLLSPQWTLIIFTGSLVVRMMDALMVVKQCSCSVDQPVTLDPAVAPSQHEPHTYSSSDAVLWPNVVVKRTSVSRIWCLCSSIARLFTVQRTQSLLHIG